MYLYGIVSGVSPFQAACTLGFHDLSDRVAQSVIASPLAAGYLHTTSPEFVRVENLLVAPGLCRQKRDKKKLLGN